MSLRGWRERGDAWVDRGVESGSKALGDLPRPIFEVAVTLVGAMVLLYLFIVKDAYYAVGFVVVLFAVLFLMRRPILLSYALFGLIPIYWMNLLGRSLRVITVLSLIGFAYHGAMFVVGRARPRYNSVFLAYALYLVTCAYSLSNSVMIMDASWPGMKYFLLALVLFAVLVVSVDQRRHLWILLLVFLGWGVAESLLGMAQTFISPRFFVGATWHSIIDAYSVGGVRRAAGTFQIGPRFAMFLLGPLAIVVAGLFSGRVFHRPIWFVLLVPLTIGIFVSLTRIAIGVSFLYVILFNVLEQRRRAIAASIAGLVLTSIVVGMTMLALPGDVKHALNQRFTDKDDEIYMDRLYFLWNALGAFTEHPLLGIGVGTYEVRSWEFMQKYPVPWREWSWDISLQWNMPEAVPVHNEYGRMLAEQGIFAIPAFFFLLFAAYRNLLYCRRRSKDDLVLLLSVGMTMYLAGLSVYWFFHQYFMEEPYISIIPFALSVILFNIVKNEEEAEERAHEPPA